jgi:hypothetical protein
MVILQEMRFVNKATTTKALEAKAKVSTFGLKAKALTSLVMASLP